MYIIGTSDTNGVTVKYKAAAGRGIAKIVIDEVVYNVDIDDASPYYEPTDALRDFMEIKRRCEEIVFRNTNVLSAKAEISSVTQLNLQDLKIYELKPVDITSELQEKFCGKKK